MLFGEFRLSPHKERQEKDFQAALMGNVFSTCFSAQPKGVNERWDELNTLLGRIHAAYQTSAAQKGRVSFIKAGSFPSHLVSL